jgi:hypothetical protein
MTVAMVDFKLVNLVEVGIETNDGCLQDSMK